MNNQLWHAMQEALSVPPDESGSEGEKKRGKTRSKRDRQQEAMASGTIKQAHVKPSKLVALSEMTSHPESAMHKVTAERLSPAI